MVGWLARSLVLTGEVLFLGWLQNNLGPEVEVYFQLIMWSGILARYQPSVPAFYLCFETGAWGEHAMFQEPQYTIQTAFESAWGLVKPWGLQCKESTRTHADTHTLAVKSGFWALRNHLKYLGFWKFRVLSLSSYLKTEIEIGPWSLMYSLVLTKRNIVDEL